MHCSRPHVSFVLASSKSQFFLRRTDLHPDRRHGRKASNLFFFLGGRRGGAWMLPDDEHSLIMSNDEAHWTTVAIWKFKQHGWREPQSSSPMACCSTRSSRSGVCALLSRTQNGTRRGRSAPSSWTRSSTMSGTRAGSRGCTANFETALASSTVGPHQSQVAGALQLAVDGEIDDCSGQRRAARRRGHEPQHHRHPRHQASRA